MKLKLSKKDIKANRGITLIALVITIIVLLILAGVTIATLTGDNGLLTKVGDARNTSEKAGEKERIQMEVAGAYDTRGRLDATKIVENIEKNIGATAEATSNSFPVKVTYNNGHKYQVASDGSIMISVNAGDKAPSDSNAVYSSGDYTAIIPAGFTVSNQPGESSIDTGLVIRDDDGNEFVWIPVNIPWKSDSNKTITLSRYTFDSNGDPTNQEANTIDSYYTELASSQYGEAVAKNIEDFKTKTNAAGGFWIGRYEARIEGYTGNVATSNSNQETSLTGYTGGKLVEKPGAQVFNYITQNKASELSRSMYSTNNYFESDLINSYAWDTATLFLQEYDNRTGSNLTKYSRQNSINTESLLATGTVSETNKDKICNVYDMASNCYEWTTETSSGSNSPCVFRGGYFSNRNFYSSVRGSYNTTGANDFSVSFRPVLYIK